MKPSELKCQLTGKDRRELEKLLKTIQKERMPLYRDLGMIALEGLKQGQLLLGADILDVMLQTRTQEAVEDEAQEEGIEHEEEIYDEEKEYAEVDEDEYTEVRSQLVKSGFVQALSDTEDKELYFLHLTFQEYFAGRQLARQWLSECPKERQKAEACILKNKDKPHYHVMLTFMAGEIFKRQQILGLQKLLQLLGVDNADSPGHPLQDLQNLLLRLRCVNECMGIDGTIIKSLDKEFALSEQFKQCIGESITHIRQNDPIGGRFHRTLLDAFPSLVHLLGYAKVAEFYVSVSREEDSKEATNSWSDADDDWRASEATDGDWGEEDGDKKTYWASETLVSSVHEAALSALSEIFKAYPKEALESLLITLQKPSRRHSAGRMFALLSVAQQNVEDTIRNKARQELIKIVKASPDEIASLIFDTLINNSTAPEPQVRVAVAQVLVEVSAAAPKHVHKAISALLALCGDDASDVQGAASDALTSLTQKIPTTGVRDKLWYACLDANVTVRKAASTSFKKLIKIGETHSLEDREALLKVLSKADWVSIDAASHTMVELVKAVPSLADHVFSILFKAINCSSEKVRPAAACVLIDLIKVVPTAQQFDTLCKVLSGSGAKYVCQVATNVLAALVQAAPEAQYRDMLLKAISGSHWQLREAAAKALRVLAVAAPTVENRDILLESSSHSHEKVRLTVIHCLEALIKKVPALANEDVRDRLLKASADSNLSVCQSAAKALSVFARLVPT
ncbi:MAG: hypothetical protein AAFP93_03085, partial [Bacteroidota bacterium]